MNKKPRSPLAHLLETVGHPLPVVAALLEQAGFVVQKHEDVASLIECWLDDFSQIPSAAVALANQGGLMLARLQNETLNIPDTAVVLLDEQHSVSTAILALRLGVADYILINAPTDEIKNRLEHLFHRLTNDIDEPLSGLESLDGIENVEVSAGGKNISWDESLNAVRRGDTWISLSPIERRLFYTLVNRRGSVVPLEDLVSKGLQRSNGTDADVPLLRLHISRLRSKLNENFGHELNVVTLRGRGYMLV